MTHLPAKPFSPFEWLVAWRYLRARRAHGSVSVIAGFSFAGIVLGVAALIVVMAVMNGFRHDLMDKLIGLNGHMFLQGVETPLTDYQAVTERVAQLPHSTFIVLYCGCCPWERCPNIGPAFKLLHDLGFSNVKALYIADNLGTDWVDKGYPVERGR